MSTHGPRPPEGIRTIGDLPAGATHLVLVRHGQAMANVHGHFGGPTGCQGLSQLGRRQAEALAGAWRQSGSMSHVGALVSSPLPRASETADLLQDGLPSAVRLASRDALCELLPGEADGLTWAEYAERFGGVDWDVDPTEPIAPAGESWYEFTARARDALRVLAEEFPGETVVVATHAGVIEASMLHFAYGGPSGRRLLLRTEHCSVTEWAVSEGEFTLIRYNAPPPLPASD